MEASWHRIAGVAQDLARLTSASRKSVDSSGSCTTSFVVPALQLRVPTDIDTHFQQPGIPSDLSKRLTNVFKEATMTLRQAHVTNYEEACRQLSVLPSPRGLSPPSGLVEKLRFAFQASYEQQLRAWIDTQLSSILKRLKTYSSSPLSSQRVSMKKQLFNNEYIPYLEQYFEENAFPSHGDKVDLARKSLMTYRQIDVWFQNRRSRARRDGKPLKKLRADELPKQSFEQLERRMADWVIPKAERVEPVDSDLSEYEWQYDSDEDDTADPCPTYPNKPNVADPFIIETPPHAFPCLYPPNCEHDPFPVKSGRSEFPAPLWMRRPTRSTVKRPVVDLDILIKAFDDMNLREGVKRRREKKKPQDSWTAPKGKRTCLSGPRRDRSAATLFITTTPLAAPLPSLIRPKTSLRVTHSPLPILPSVPATMSRRHAFQSPSPGSRPITLVPLPQSVAGTEKHRKIAPLPKRMPAGTHRGHTPASSPAVSASPTQSRVSSVRSDSPQTRTCSDSSSPSSSTVATPISSSAPLLEPSFALSDLFGDTPVNALSPVEGLQLDFGSIGNIGGGKQSFGLPCSPAHFLRAQS